MTRHANKQNDRVTVKYPETGPAHRTRLVVLCGLDQEQLQQLPGLSRDSPVVTHVIPVHIFLLHGVISLQIFRTF